MEKSSQVMLLSCMGAMMKGMLKGFNKRMSHIFVVKEQEMEIGGPTDVKHVAHIGFDGSATTNNAPSWMGEFKTGPGFAACSIGRTSGSAVPPLSATQTTTEICKVMSEASPAPPPKKHRRKKHKKSSSPSPTASSTTKTSGRSSHPKRKPKAKAADGNAKITNLEVAS